MLAIRNKVTPYLQIVWCDINAVLKIFFEFIEGIIEVEFLLVVVQCERTYKLIS